MTESWRHRLSQEERSWLLELEAEIEHHAEIARVRRIERRALVDRVRKRLRTPIDKSAVSA